MGIRKEALAEEARGASKGARHLVERETRAHKVNVNDFWMTRSEITVGQFDDCVRRGVCAAPPKKHRCPFYQPDSRELPMTCVTHQDAETFCRWAGGRLPAEEEWEFAARSRGKRYRYPWGNGARPSCQLLIMDSKGSGCGRRNVWPVCSRGRGNTEQGLCDMAGNAWEWVSNAPFPYPGSPITDLPDGHRVIRGGGIGSLNDYRTTLRESRQSKYRGSALSFRCAADERPGG